MRTTRAVAKAVRKKTECNPVYGGRRQEVREPHPFLREIPRENDQADEQETAGDIHPTSPRPVQQRRDGRPPSPQPETVRTQTSFQTELNDKETLGLRLLN